jgi:general secretion pathway protein G
MRPTIDADGFTLFEILIVIVVLGILAAVVIYDLGGIGSKGAVASCEADGSTVSSALSDFNTQNPTLFSNVQGTASTGQPPSAPGSYTTATAQALLESNTLGGPWVQSWPNNYPHYAFQLAWVDQVANPPLGSAGVWTMTLEVATGNSRQGTGPNYTYVAAGAAGNVVAPGGSPATNYPGLNAAPWIPYSGPGTCTGVA